MLLTCVFLMINNVEHFFFSRDLWPFICLLWRNVYLGLWPYFEQVVYLKTFVLRLGAGICSNMDGPRDYHTKQSQSERERQMVSLTRGL